MIWLSLVVYRKSLFYLLAKIVSYTHFIRCCHRFCCGNWNMGWWVIIGLCNTWFFLADECIDIATVRVAISLPLMLPVEDFMAFEEMFITDWVAQEDYTCSVGWDAWALIMQQQEEYRSSSMMTKYAPHALLVHFHFHTLPPASASYCLSENCMMETSMYTALTTLWRFFLRGVKINTSVPEQKIARHYRWLVL